MSIELTKAIRPELVLDAGGNRRALPPTLAPLSARWLDLATWASYHSADLHEGIHQLEASELRNRLELALGELREHLKAWHEWEARPVMILSEHSTAPARPRDPQTRLPLRRRVSKGKK